MKPKFFRMAKKAMQNSTFSGRAKIGCAIIYRGNVLAFGSNTDKTTPTQRKYNDWRFVDCGTPAKTHAEIAALRKIRWLDIKFNEVEVYIYREDKDGNLALAMPCPSCVAYMKTLGIYKVCYTTPHGYVEGRLNY